ncbi:hypothetical protein [Pelagibacterium sp.]|uniref:hypothetical protein n=1 Tax=Pelagibacterium sp. TaxID=1967288 RepID=UPI003A8D1A2E
MKFLLYVLFGFDLFASLVIMILAATGKDVGEAQRYNGLRLLIEVAALAVIAEIGKRGAARG